MLYSTFSGTLNTRARWAEKAGSGCENISPTPGRTCAQYEALYSEILEGGAPRPTQDKNGEAVLIGAVLDTLEKYSGEFYEMGSQIQEMGSQIHDLKRFEAGVKQTLAYKAYKAAKTLAGKLRK